MPTTFEELQVRAAKRWDELTSGESAWVRVGGGTSGQAVGADAVFEAFKSSVKSTGVSANVSMVSAMGLMYLEPQVDILMPNGSRVFYGNVEPDEAQVIVEQHVKNGEPLLDRAFAYSGGDGSGVGNLPELESMPMVALQQRIATRNFGDTDPHDLLQYVANGGYQALNRALMEMAPEQIVDEIKASGLRGRGGAAFPAGVKWSFLAPSDAPVKYVLCNCEEGDPGAFNDKGIIENDPHTLVEGLIINGYATRSTHGYIFIRTGHELPIEAARKAIYFSRGNSQFATSGKKFLLDLRIEECEYSTLREIVFTELERMKKMEIFPVLNSLTHSYINYTDDSHRKNEYGRSKRNCLIRLLSYMNNLQDIKIKPTTLGELQNEYDRVAMPVT